MKLNFLVVSESQKFYGASEWGEGPNSDQDTGLAHSLTGSTNFNLFNDYVTLKRFTGFIVRNNYAICGGIGEGHVAGKYKHSSEKHKSHPSHRESNTLPRG
jgi:hypothetical protein